MNNEQIVLSSILSLIKFQRSATIAEIAKISGIKQSIVLSVLNDNLNFIIKDSKNPKKIIGITAYLDNQHRAFLSDKYYEYGDYYGIKTVSCYNQEFLDKFPIVSYDIGECTENKQKFLDENGFQEVKNAPYIYINKVWKENGNDVSCVNYRGLLGRRINKNLL